MAQADLKLGNAQLTRRRELMEAFKFLFGFR